MNPASTVIHWFRQDLRLHDNPALLASLRCSSLLPVACLPLTDEPCPWGFARVGPHRASWRMQALQGLDTALGSHLLVLRGAPKLVLPALARAAGTQRICCEASALAHLSRYMQRGLPKHYKATRNALRGRDFSSKFSPWLATGALSARQVCQALQTFETQHGPSEGSHWLWVELLWRDHFRFIHTKHGRRLYGRLGLSARSPHGQQSSPRHDAATFDAWRAGAAWFEHHLIDFDTHSNHGNWLYIAGHGTDPRGGRRFNPDKQTREHDPDGSYRRSWACSDYP